MRIARFWIGSWIAAAAVWMLLVDNTSAAEVFPGAAAAAIAATGAALVYAQRVARVRVRPRWILRAWRPLVAAPRDVVIVLAAIVRSLFAPGRRQGQVRALRFEAVGDDPAEQARRALTEATGSFAPNTIVLGIDNDRRRLIVHQLRPSQDLEAAGDPLDLR